MPPPNALALQIPLNAGEEPIVETIVDVDAFDADDCSIYALDPSDEDYMHMIEASFGEACDCGNRIFIRNRCTNCGAQAPWASKLGCGLR